MRFILRIVALTHANFISSPQNFIDFSSANQYRDNIDYRDYYSHDRS